MDVLRELQKRRDKKQVPPVLVFTGDTDFAPMLALQRDFGVGDPPLICDYLIKGYVGPPGNKADPANEYVMMALALGRALLAREEGCLPTPMLVGVSNAIVSAYKKLRMVAHQSGTSRTLICGETGTGKEVAARLVHFLSARRATPFVAVNCAAIPKDLMESELLGHVKGAYSGATEKRDGLFVEANGGTLFLDEIGELPLQLQAKLLRVLDDGMVMPVGGGQKQVKHTNVSVVCATNRDLRTEVAEGRFREDLMYRIMGDEIELPPLRARPQDIGPLFRHFLRMLATDYPEVHGVSPREEVLGLLAEEPFPGNVRQLEVAVKRMLKQCRADGRNEITPDVVREALAKQETRSKLGSSSYEAARVAIERLAGTLFQEHVTSGTTRSVDLIVKEYAALGLADQILAHAMRLGPTDGQLAAWFDYKQNQARKVVSQRLKRAGIAVPSADEG